MGGLTRARYVRHRGNSRSPVGREPHGDGALIVVRGRESRPHGEGGQVVGRPGRGGTRHAERRDDPDHHPKGHRPLESCVRRKSHAQFGGGRTEKDAAGCPSLPSHYGPVNEPRHETYLAGRLPYLRDPDRPGEAKCRAGVERASSNRRILLANSSEASETADSPSQRSPSCPGFGQTISNRNSPTVSGRFREG